MFLLTSVSLFIGMLRFTSKKLFTPFNRQLIANMGGHALKRTQVQRVTLQEYNEIKADVKEKLQNYLDIDFPYDRPGKTDFGDVDILYKHKGLNVVVLDLVEHIFRPIEMYKNGGVLSFAYYLKDSKKYVQVDLIKAKHMEMAKFYFSWGDAGNILGHMTKFHGIKMGHHGFFLSPTSDTIKEYDGTTLPNTNISLEIELSTDPAKVCEFMGLNYEQWSKFTSVEEIFDWIKSCRLYRSNMFNRSNNSDHRKKLANRPMYLAFFESTLADEKNGKIKGRGLKKNQQMDAIVFFERESQMEVCVAAIKRNHVKKRLFNGQKFMNYGLSGIALGNAIVDFKKHLHETTGLYFDQWLEDVVVEDDAKVDQSIADFLREYKPRQGDERAARKREERRSYRGVDGDSDRGAERVYRGSRSDSEEHEEEDEAEDDFDSDASDRSRK